MKKNKHKELTPRQREFINSYERNAGDTARICDELNITPSRCTVLMNAPAVRERITRATERAGDMIKAAAPALARIAIDLAMNEDVNVKVRANLIDSLLDRAGLTPPKEPATNININVNQLISERARSILGERQKEKELPTIETTADTIESDT